MRTEWSLDELYKGFDDPQYDADERALAEVIESYREFTEDLSGEPARVLQKGLIYNIDLQERVSKLYLFAELKQSVQTTDADAAAALGRINQIMTGLAAPDTAFVKYVASVEGLEDIIKRTPFLREYEFYLTNIRDSAKHTLSADVEEAVSLYEISGSGAWSELQGYLTSTLPVEYDGRITNLADIRNKAYDPDPAVRKSAYEAELAAYDRIKDSVAYSLNSIKLEVINHCRLRGYASPMAEALDKAHMKQETLDALLSAIEEYLPKFWEYMRAKARLLGHENGLPWYEINAPLKGNDKSFTPEECREYLISLFSGFDAEEAEVMRTAFDEAWIDFYPRDGKVGGAFCAGAHGLKAFRILTNYGGKLGDVVTLAHELGHGFHDHCLSENSILNIDVSMPLAETASTFNEVVAMNAAIRSEADPVARRALIESQLSDAAQIICDIYSRYLFEKSVFDNRESGIMFADRLCELMLDAQKKAYGSGLDHEFLHPYMWVCKSHYYSSGLSYYNWPYAFGGLFARGLYALYQREGESFVPGYKELLKSSGYRTVEDTAASAGIDVTDRAFWCSSLQVLADEIDEFTALCDIN